MALQMPRLADARAVISRVVSSAWRPPEEVAVDEWADRNRILIADAAAEPGPWRTDRAPYTREVMRSYGNRRVRRVSLMFGSQLAKTETLYNEIFFTADRDPQPTLFVYPTEVAARDASEDRFIPSLMATTAVASRIRGGLDADGQAKRKSVKSRKIKFDRMTLWIIWANGKMGVKGKPIGRVFSDEIDEYIPGRIAHLDARLKTFHGRGTKHVLASTPTFEGYGIHEEYCRGDQRHYEVPCPGCRRFQELVWSQVRWEGGSRADPQVVKLNTWYACIHCARRIEHIQLPKMLLGGRWIREGEWIDAAGNTRGRPKVPDSDHHSYRLNTLYSPFYPWGELAAGFLEEGCEPSRDWWNNFGDPWRQKGVRAEVEDLRRLAVKVADGGYAFNEVPGTGQGDNAGVLALTAHIDVQQDRAIYEVVGWGERGRDVYLIRCGSVAISDGGDDLPELDFLRSMRFSRRIGGRTLPIARSVIDTGHKFRRVCSWCRRHGSWAVPVKGEDAQHMLTEWRLTKIDKDADGKPLDQDGGGLLALLVNTWKYKEAVVDKLRARPADEIQGTAPVGRWLFPEGTDDEYFRQLTAEEFGIDPRTKRPGWLKRRGRNANHYLDCRVYGLALADYMRVSEMTAVGMDALRRKIRVASESQKTTTAARVKVRPEPEDEREQKSEHQSMGKSARGEWRPGYREEW